MSVRKVSMIEFGAEERREVAREARLSGFRARRATARLPWDGCARMRAMPAPLEDGISLGSRNECWEELLQLGRRQ